MRDWKYYLTRKINHILNNYVVNENVMFYNFPFSCSDELSDHSHQVSVCVSLVVFPLANALLTGQTKLDCKAHCYVRYKFYDKRKSNLFVVDTMYTYRSLRRGYMVLFSLLKVVECEPLFPISSKRCCFKQILKIPKLYTFFILYIIYLLFYI